jgi:hypothetical protein
MFEEADLIHVYTRAQAVRDGVLIDVSAMAREAGMRYPVAVTRAVWERCVAVPAGVVCQDETGRLLDVLWMLRMAARGAHGPELAFAVHVRNDNRDGEPPRARLRAVCGPGDDAKPVITVMLPNED